MSEFNDLEKKARAYAEEHPEQADKGINEAAGFAKHETDHQHDEQIDRAVDAAEQKLHDQRRPAVEVQDPRLYARTGRSWLTGPGAAQVNSLSALFDR